jgi:hypothetical protein
MIDFSQQQLAEGLDKKTADEIAISHSGNCGH